MPRSDLRDPGAWKGPTPHYRACGFYTLAKAQVGDDAYRYTAWYSQLPRGTFAPNALNLGTFDDVQAARDACADHEAQQLRRAA